MRLVSGVLALTLFAPLVRAQEAPSAAPVRPGPTATDGARSKIALRVVRVMPESHQALLYDRDRATHVLAETGGKVAGYTVDDIDDDEVTLSRDGKVIVLAAPAAAPAPAPAPRDRRRDRDGDVVHAGPAGAASQPDTADAAASPVDPYADPAPRVVEAPGAPAAAALAPGEGGVRVVRAPTGGPAPRPIEAGADGVRVAQAPGTTGATPQAEPAHALPDIEAARLPADPAIRVAEAPRVAEPAPGAADHAAATAPAATAPAASDPTSAARPVAGPAGDTRARPGPSGADAPGADAAEPAVPAGRATGASPPTPTPASGDRAATAARSDAIPAFVPTTRVSTSRAGAPDRRTARSPRPAPPAANQQALDARALADIMTSDTGRAPRGPSSDALGATAAAPSSASDARPASPASEPRTPSAGRPGDATLSRSEVDAALADFAGLTAAVRGSFSATGLVIEGVADDSIFQRAGLRAGDVISAIDGARLRTLDDAANLYARAATAKALTVQLVRAGQPMTLHVVIQ